MLHQANHPTRFFLAALGLCLATALCASPPATGGKYFSRLSGETPYNTDRMNCISVDLPASLGPYNTVISGDNPRSTRSRHTPKPSILMSVIRINDQGSRVESPGTRASGSQRSEQSAIRNWAPQPLILPSISR